MKRKSILLLLFLFLGMIYVINPVQFYFSWKEKKAKQAPLKVAEAILRVLPYYQGSFVLPDYLEVDILPPEKVAYSFRFWSSPFPVADGAVYHIYLSKRLDWVWFSKDQEWGGNKKIYGPLGVSELLDLDEIKNKNLAIDQAVAKWRKRKNSPEVLD